MRDETACLTLRHMTKLSIGQMINCKFSLQPINSVLFCEPDFQKVDAVQIMNKTECDCWQILYMYSIKNGTKTVFLIFCGRQGKVWNARKTPVWNILQVNRFIGNR